MSDVATVKEGHQPRLGMVGRDEKTDIVVGIVLLQKDEKSLPALSALNARRFMT